MEICEQATTSNHCVEPATCSQMMTSYDMIDMIEYDKVGNGDNNDTCTCIYDEKHWQAKNNWKKCINTKWKNIEKCILEIDGKLLASHHIHPLCWTDDLLTGEGK